MKKLLIALTLLGSMSSFAAENAIRLEDRIDELYPTELVTYVDLQISGTYFLALTGSEKHRNNFEAATKRADSICHFLKYPKGALGYKIYKNYPGAGERNYHTIEDNQLVTDFYETQFFTEAEPEGFESINCKL